jgi:hypothetical protein
MRFRFFCNDEATFGTTNHSSFEIEKNIGCLWQVKQISNEEFVCKMFVCQKKAQFQMLKTNEENTLGATYVFLV